MEEKAKNFMNFCPQWYLFGLTDNSPCILKNGPYFWKAQRLPVSIATIFTKAYTANKRLIIDSKKRMFPRNVHKSCGKNPDYY